jgi:hypothetical protein
MLAGNGRILFARVGWMRFYRGPTLGDERPVGGGKYTEKNIGLEAYNFRDEKGTAFGYFQPTMISNRVSLERIDGAKANTQAQKLDGVLVIFVARSPEFGQVIVGWYKNAEVLRDCIATSPGKPSGYGHFCLAASSECVLLPDEKRSFTIPVGAGGIGQSNVCYPLNQNRTPKHARWMREAEDYVRSYK